jgi:hypothetical protein
MRLVHAWTLLDYYCTSPYCVRPHSFNGNVFFHSPLSGGTELEKVSIHHPGSLNSV